MSCPVAVRIPAGKTEALRQLFSESLGPRKAEYDDLQRRSGITDEAYWLQSDGDGDSLKVISNRDQVQFMEIMANPKTDFDRWFRDRMQEIFAFDRDAPPSPPSELLGRWSAKPVYGRGRVRGHRLQVFCTALQGAEGICSQRFGHICKGRP